MARAVYNLATHQCDDGASPPVGRTKVSWVQQLRLGSLALRGSPSARLAYALVLADDDEHGRALRQFAQAAHGGLPHAQFRLGRCYLLGLGVPSGLDAALRWLTQAAEGHDVEAQVLLASLALQGISMDAKASLFEPATRHAGQPADYQMALHWGRQAADAGSAEAQTLVGYILTSGPEELQDPPRAAQYYQQAAANGFAQGQLGWALALLRDGASPAVDAEAWQLLESAANADLPAAHFALGVLAEQAGAEQAVAEQAGAEQAEHNDDRLTRGTAHYREAAEHGHRSAQFRYGIALLTGRGVKQDAQSGETWLRRAGLAGEPLAAAMVGDIYARQADGQPNFCEAAMWFERAAAAGHVGAARALGQVCLRGGGFGTDPVSAAHWLRVAATADDLVAAYELGICLAHGIGTTRNDAEALQWFRRAIEVMPEAQYWVARMMDEGRGTAQDSPAARAFYLRAAAEGNGDAATAAGEMLVNGRGGLPDRPAAMRLFLGAAARGHKGAQYALSVLEPANDTGAPAIGASAIGASAIGPSGNGVSGGEALAV